MNEQATTAETEFPPVSDAEGPIPKFPPLAVDPVTGKLLPMSDEELRGPARRRRQGDQGDRPDLG